ncbi:Protein of uncharacterised function (DUF1281) [Escherichia coli]|nr:Protein of uncharacterised function (DUF1281) [Escherichia coli]
MPNWCSNRMYFSGEPAQIAEIKRLASGAVTPLYRRATNEGIQLFLAGSAGLLQTTEDVRFEPCPGLTAAGRGVVSPENIAFTPKRGDWCDIWSNEDVSVWWNRLCDNVLPEKPCRLTC